MAPKKTYSKFIDIDSMWHHAEKFGIQGKPDDTVLDALTFQELSMQWPNSGKNSIEINFRQFAILESLLGYSDPFFQSSEASFNGTVGSYEGLIDQLVYAKLNFEWIKNYIDGDFASKEVLIKLEKIGNNSSTLRDLLSEFTEYHRLIKIRRRQADLTFKEQYNSEEESHSILSKKLDWSNYYDFVQSLDLLSDLVEETKPMFTSAGGAPFKFSKPWLILEAVQIYEDWNVENLSAGISLDHKTGAPTGPFTRFLEQFFDAIDPSYNKNSGLASTASKLLKSVKENNNLGMHRYLNPDLPEQKYMQALRVLKSNS